MDMLGMDEIINDSEAILRQTVSHRKTLRETTTITVNETYITTEVKQTTIKFTIFSRTKTETHITANSTVQQWVSVDETSIEVTRLVEVRPGYVYTNKPNVYYC